MKALLFFFPLAGELFQLQNQNELLTIILYFSTTDFKVFYGSVQVPLTEKTELNPVELFAAALSKRQKQN